MPSILESFDQPLPIIKDWPTFDHNGTEKPAPKLGTETKRASPPRWWVEVPYNHWADQANAILDKLKKDKKSVVAKTCVPEKEPGMFLMTEGDVVRCSTLYLAHPVHMAFGHFYGDPNFVFTAEASKSNIARADMLYSTSKTNFAVLEYKASGVIRKQEFDKAELTENKRASFMAEPFECNFHGNSKVLMTRAVHYASSYDTKYIALFDYRTLVLLYMDCVNGKDGGFHCLATIISKPENMRRALLGFLATAYLASKGMVKPPPCPDQLNYEAAHPSDGGKPNTRATAAATREAEASGQSGTPGGQAQHPQVPTSGSAPSTAQQSTTTSLPDRGVQGGSKKGSGTQGSPDRGHAASNQASGSKAGDNAGGRKKGSGGSHAQKKGGNGKSPQ